MYVLEQEQHSNTSLDQHESVEQYDPPAIGMAHMF